MSKTENKAIDLEQRLYRVRDAWGEQFAPRPPMPPPMPVEKMGPWIESVMDDAVIMADEGGLYRIPYTINGDSVTFGTKERVERQTVYKPQKTYIKSITADSVNVAGYGVVFGDYDLEGDTFERNTDFDADYVPTKRVYYDHALDTAAEEPLGVVTTTRLDEIGLWVEAQLDRSRKYVDAVTKLVEQGRLGWSSGSISHLVRREGKSIKRWPIVEFSLTPTPAEPRTLGVQRLKALLDDHPELKALLEDGAIEALSADASAGDAVKSDTDTGVVTMAEQETAQLAPTVDVAAIAKAVVDEAVKAFRAQLENEPPSIKGAAKVAPEVKDAPAPAFKSLGEQLIAVRNAAFGQHDNRLNGLKAILGGNENIPSEGGYLVSTAQDAGIDRKVWDVGVFANRAQRVSLPAGANAMDFYGRDEDSRANGSRYGGLTGYRMAEGGTITASGTPKFYRYTLKPKKYGVLAYLTDEVINDASVLEQELSASVPEELAFMVNDDMFRGLGAAGPLGVMASDCLISAAKEVGQAADTIVWENILEMWNRRWPGGNYTWYINQEVEKQLDQMAQAVGNAALPARFIDYGPTGALRMKGCNVVTNEYSAAIGDAGDILLADWSQYKLATIGGVQSASSMHVQFLTDQMCYRFTLRVDGQPTWKAALTPYKATSSRTVSPFVVLEAR